MLFRTEATGAQSGTKMNEFTGLRVGVVGCGYWGSKHVRALSAIDAVEKVVVIDPSRPRLEALSRAFPNVEPARRCHSPWTKWTPW